jgi:serine/threonine-protein kinase
MTTPPERLTAALADRYALESELGAGGMATVYLAHDVKHNRKVAVKVLRSELAAVLGAERFLKEIEVTANLQHPHILALYDSGEADGFLYYVMPYVEGETLYDRLEREKQLGIDDAVRIAGEMAAALDYAHRQGVVHRDIKPPNVLLQDGGVLVADFGIALALKAAGGDRLTETGLSLGTPHYMSPEQAAGDRDVDARTDVYALGAVLYEMLAGEPPHTGSTIQAVLSRVLTEEPRPVTEMRQSVPPHVAMVVQQALAKVPGDRFGSAAEFAAALKDTGFRLATTAVRTAVATASRPWYREPLAWAAAAVVLVLGVLMGRGTAPDTEQRGPLARFRIPIEDMYYSGITGSPVNTLALSPDGQAIVFVGRTGAGVQLFLRRLESVSAVPLEGTVGASFPIFSADGSRVAYFASGVMFEVPVNGGTPTRLANVPAQALTQAVWMADGSIMVTGTGGALIRVRRDGSVEEILPADTAAGETYIGPNAMLPGERAILAIPAVGTGVNGPVIAVELASGTRTPVIDAVVNAVWHSDGYLLWSDPTGALFGAGFDADRLELTTSPVTLADGVRLTVGGQAQVAVSDNGSMVYIPEQPFNLMLVDRSGRRETVAEGRRFHSPRFSPDGSLLAVDFIQQGARDVWTLDMNQRTLTRVSFESDGHDPVWLPEGGEIAYVSRNVVLRRRVDGGGGVDTVPTPPNVLANNLLEYLPDGSGALISLAIFNSSFDVERYDFDGSGTRETVLATPFNEEAATLSPDGQWLAYSSNETGFEEVYVRRFPSGGGKTLVSQGGGREPVWHPNGGELFYVGQEGAVPYVMAAAVEAASDAFVVRGHTALFDAAEFEPSSPHRNYDITPDGSRFALVHQGTLSEIIMVLNWPAEVERAAADLR